MPEEKSIDDVVRNTWGSWRDLYNMTKRDMEECERRGVGEEIGTLQFKRSLMGNVKMSSNDFAEASKAVSRVIKKIKREQEEQCEQNNEQDGTEKRSGVTKRMIVDAKNQELREMNRAGSEDDYIKTMFG